jgi:hypothetical protein
MRTISQTDLNRHKKRKGITVKRKLGSAPEKPESEVNGKPLSGDLSKTEATPAPASEFYSLMAGRNWPCDADSFNRQSRQSVDARFRAFRNKIHHRNLIEIEYRFEVHAQVPS